jgi:UDP-GlcNAc:undecaprenyl-phosphate/decaprenyl-phosphate GlcNAc-1-phosphate transferase
MVLDNFLIYMDRQSIISLLGAFTLCLVLTPVVRWFAIKNQWEAKPSNDRWHTKTTALMGGIAIFAAVMIPLLGISDFSSVWQLIRRTNGHTSLPSIGATLAIGAAFLFVIGLMDDFRNIKPQTKLVGQILAASLVAFLGFRLHWFNSLTLDTIATLFWVVGVTNAFNLIDNMDGLCAGVGMVASASLAVLFHATAPEAFRLALILAGASAGFLVYNFKPAKIFMGDCGSLVIGFSISLLALYFPETGPSTYLATIAVPILVLLVPILDTSLVTIIRLLSGRKASTGGRDHTSHRLVLIGFSESSAVLFLYGVGAVAGVAGIFVSQSDSVTSPAVILPVILAIVLMGVYLSQLRVYPEKEFSVLRDHRFARVVVNITYKKQLLFVALDSVIIIFSYYAAYRLRFDGPAFSHYFSIFLKSLPIIIGCKMMVFLLIGTYRGFWAYISTSDVFLYIRASFLASLACVVVVTFAYRFRDFSKGIFVLDWLITTGLLLGVRGSFRLFLETHKRKTLSGDKVVIYGAGRGGELLLREIINNKKLNVQPLGFLDDDPSKKGKKIQGYPILGTFEAIDGIHAQHQLNGILISFNDMNGHHAKTLEAAKEFCSKRKIHLKRFKINLQKVDLDS